MKQKFQHFFQGRTLHLHVLVVTITTHAFGLTTITLSASQSTTGSGITILYPTRQASSKKITKIGKKDAWRGVRSALKKPYPISNIFFAIFLQRKPEIEKTCMTEDGRFSIPYDPNHNNCKLNIVRARPEDSGIWQCTVIDRYLGVKDTKEFIVQVNSGGMY